MFDCCRDVTRVGRGVLTTAKDGHIYDCTWEDNRKTGLGIVYFHASGDFYKGFFQDDRMEGFGTYFEAKS